MQLITKQYNKSKFLQKKPVFIGVVAGIKFYEHPVFGDEYPLVAIFGDKCGLTDFWEIPILEEIGYLV